jgi:hypothetical protein
MNNERPLIIKKKLKKRIILKRAHNIMRRDPPQNNIFAVALIQLNEMRASII